MSLDNTILGISEPVPGQSRDRSGPMVANKILQGPHFNLDLRDTVKVVTT